MNERIRELSKQAGDYVNETYTGPVRSKTPGKIWEDGHIGWHTQFNQKFAELIVQECAALAKSKSERIQSMETDNRGDQAQIHSLAWQFEEFGYKIKKHFGVEE